MKLPCETALWYILPQIRADLAIELVKHDLNQKDAAEKLGLTPSAVSQYIHKKRAGKLKRTQEYKKRIEKAAKEIKKSSAEKEISNIICRCCRQTYSAP